jgi:hypothetical protein
VTKLEKLREALRPFAREGEKWLGTPAVHDDLVLLVGEDYCMMEHRGRDAEFTIGDLKRAARLLR